MVSPCLLPLCCCVSLFYHPVTGFCLLFLDSWCYSWFVLCNFCIPWPWWTALFNEARLFFSRYLPPCVSCVWVPFCLSMTLCVLIRASLFFAFKAGQVILVSIKHGRLGLLARHQPKAFVWQLVNESHQLCFSRITKHDLKIMCKTLKCGHLCLLFCRNDKLRIYIKKLLSHKWITSVI